MKIWLDATPVIHGERAVRRNTRNLLSSLLSRNRANYGLLYFDRRGNAPGRLALPPKGGSIERVRRWPVRLLLPGWRWFGEPSFERLVGKVDLLYSPNLYFPPVRRGKVLCTIHGIIYLKRKDLLNSSHRRRLTKAFSYARLRSDYFLAVSETTRRDLLECTDIPEERIYVVTHGVDSRFKTLPKDLAWQAVRKRFNLNRPYLIYVGAVATHKNVHGLVEAFSLVSSQEKNLDLVLAGPEETTARLVRAKVFAEQLENRVHFLGQIEQEGSALVELYNAAEMLVFPSFYEGWCAPPLEAMACGIPVVCSCVPAVAEVVGDAGILVNPKDPEVIADAICKILNDSGFRQQLIQKGIDHVAQHTWDRAAERLETIFANILGTI